MSLSHKEYQIIEHYLQGTLTKEEESVFQTQKDNIDFQEELRFQKMLKEELIQQKRNQIRDFLKAEITAETSTEESQQGRALKVVKTTKQKNTKSSSKILRFVRPLLALSACLVFLVMATPYIQDRWQHRTEEAIYATYHQAEPSTFMISVVASAQNTVSIEQEIKRNYDQQQYSAALASIEKLAIPRQTGILMLQANAYLQLGETIKAINLLTNIIEQDIAPNYTATARWHLAMAYFKNKDKNNAKKVLAQIAQGSNSFKKKEATKILKNLK